MLRPYVNAWLKSCLIFNFFQNGKNMGNWCEFGPHFASYFKNEFSCIFTKIYNNL